MGVSPSCGVNCGEIDRAQPPPGLKRSGCVASQCLHFLESAFPLIITNKRQACYSGEEGGKEEGSGSLCQRLQGHKPGRVGPGVSPDNGRPLLMAGC